MQGLGNQTYSDQEVLEALTGANRVWRFRYELLDSNNEYIRDLDKVISCTVSQNALAQIKRTIKLEMQEDSDINFLRDRIKPYAGIRMPDGGYREWPQGVFLLTSPTRKLTSAGTRVRSISGYDQLLILRDDKTEDRYTVEEGEKYTDRVSDLLDDFDAEVIPSSLELPTDMEWEPGTSFITIINDLLRGVNYESLWFDEDGVAVARPYLSPQNRPSEYTYGSGSDSTLLTESDLELDLFDVPNKFVCVVSEPEREPLVASYTNSDPSSPTSTVSRGRTIVRIYEQQNAVDQLTLDARAERLAFEASQVFESVEFQTGLMPFHSHADVYRVTHPRLGVDAKYSEHTWEMPLRAGEKMSHRIRRVVSV